jgi:hypothetical protein
MHAGDVSLEVLMPRVFSSDAPIVISSSAAALLQGAVALWLVSEG